MAFSVGDMQKRQAIAPKILTKIKKQNSDNEFICCFVSIQVFLPSIVLSHRNAQINVKKYNNFIMEKYTKKSLYGLNIN